MKEAFVEVNNRILDFEEYKRNFVLLKKIISTDMKEYFLNMGFKTIIKANKSFAWKIKFYNQELDMEISLRINKKEKTDVV